MQSPLSAARTPAPAAEPPPPTEERSKGIGEPPPREASHDSSRPGKTSPKGNKEAIRAVIRQLSPMVRDCYDQGLKANPTMEGTVQVKMLLQNAPDGGAFAKEGEIGDGTTLGAPLVEACILSKMQTAHFSELTDVGGAKGEGGLRVTYPFKLQPGTGFGGWGLPLRSVSRTMTI